jgi:D-alanine-D-alanine ligase-like ATP-grasp enzyme
MELSTQILIQEAQMRGCEVEILDAQSQFIRLRRGNQTEYIRQATKTRLDSYVTSELLGNKKITKLMLEEAGITTPKGMSFNHLESALEAYEQIQNGKWVVKPNSTNYGLGVTLLSENPVIEEYEHALQVAFDEDIEVLVEEFLEGKEARFLVIDGECVAVLERIPAHVVGDGIHSVQELVAIKNQDPRRGTGHTKAFEIIQLGDIEEEILEEQILTSSSVPSLGQHVALRKNSNISTGGESRDLTDSTHETYKQLAIKATQALGASICGVDVIAKNFSQPANSKNVGILELNYNPALFIHNFPFEGKNRHVECKVLDALGLVSTTL